MPEGPEIRRAADQIELALKEKILVDVILTLDHLKPFEARLKGSKVQRIDTWGKAMLTRFENGLTLYTHNQLYGRWLVGKVDAQPTTKRKLRVALMTEDSAARLYSASTIELLTDKQVQQHPFLSRLGPDILHPSTDATHIKQRLQTPKFYKRQLGYLLTDQRCLAGLGNYLRCETLFAAALHPAMRPVDCTDIQLEKLANAIIILSQQSYMTGGITNDTDRAKQLMTAGATFEQARFNIFRREGLPCYQCCHLIKKVTHTGQTCYICNQCQPEH
jgi:endonuclease-8